MNELFEDVSTITDTKYSAFMDGVESGSSWDAVAPPKLFGRSEELRQIIDAYERVRETKETEILVVHGESGSGKTALVESMRNHVADTDGFFCSGKCFQNERMPYSVIMSALSDLCDLVLQSDDFTEDKRKDIQEKLGSEGRQLIKYVNGIAALIGDAVYENIAAHNAIDVKMEAASYAKFNAAGKSFLRAMSSEQHTTVVFLDDLQWLDEGSLHLLNIFLDDPRHVPNNLYIFTYRDDEALSLTETFSKLLAQGKRFLDIHLGNLNPSAAFDMINDYIISPGARHMVAARKLSDLIHDRTRGNPYHVHQFMDALLREGLLTFDSSSATWMFDVDQIQSEMMVSETLADLLLQKLQSLSQNAREMLKIASFLGYRFKKETIMDLLLVLFKSGDLDLVERDNESRSSGEESFKTIVVAALTEARQGNFLEKTRDGFQFSHDKVLASCRATVDEKQAGRIHLRVGEYFLQRNYDESCSYQAALHLNRFPGFLAAETDRERLALINLKAAKFCQGTSAYAEAVSFLRKGLKMLEVDERSMWTDFFALSYQMAIMLAQMELVLGEFERCKDICREITCHCTSMEMKIDTLLIETEARMSGNEMNEAFQVGNRLLGYLGIKMPKRVARLHIIRKLFRVKLLTLRKKNSDILALPLMQDSLMLMAIRVLVTVALQGFLRDEPVQAIFSALVATELTLKHGLAPYSAGAIVIYAVVELSSGNYRKAYRLGNLAVQLLDRMQCKEVDCPTMFIWLTVIAHWSDAIRKLSTPLVKAMNTGIEVGDFIYSTYSLAHCFGVSLIVGTNLRRLEEFMQAGYRRIRELSGDTMVFWLLPSIQFVLNLQSHATQWSDLLILTGEVMNEAEYKRQAMESGDRVILPFVSYIKADLARTFGFLEMAQEHFEAATVNEKDWERTFINAHFCFMGAFIYYERYRQTRRRQHLKQARTYKKKIQKIESVGSPNARPFLAYVEAEEESLKPNASIPRLTALFNQAIQVMAAEKWPHQEGQVNERAGFVFAELGLCEEAERYFERAMDLYRYEWGSPPKYEWLKETCAVVLARHTPLHGVLTDRSHVNEIKVHVGNE